MVSTYCKIQEHVILSEAIFQILESNQANVRKTTDFFDVFFSGLLWLTYKEVLDFFRDCEFLVFALNTGTHKGYELKACFSTQKWYKCPSY